MQNLVIVGFCLLAALAFSLSALLAPFLSFHQYAHKLPVVSSNSHIQNSLASIRDAGLASLCLSPILSQLPVVCSWRTDASPDVYATLADLALIQGNMGDQLTTHDLTSPFNSVLSIQRASDIVLAFDDLALLFEDGNLGLHGTDHVQLLVDVNRASRSLWAALYRITLHVELGLGRLAYVDKTVLAGMKRFTLSNNRHEIVPVAPLLLSHLVNISSSATLDSIRHIQAEVVTAQATFSVLLEALQRFTKDRRARRQCALTRVKNICTEISVLWRGEERIQAVRDELARVTQVLDSSAQGLFAIGTSRNGAPQTRSTVTAASIGIDARKLGESTQKLLRCSWFARQARKVAAAVLETSRV